MHAVCSTHCVPLPRLLHLLSAFNGLQSDDRLQLDWRHSTGLLACCRSCTLGECHIHGLLCTGCALYAPSYRWGLRQQFQYGLRAGRAYHTLTNCQFWAVMIGEQCSSTPNSSLQNLSIFCILLFSLPHFLYICSSFKERIWIYGSCLRCLVWCILVGASMDDEQLIVRPCLSWCESEFFLSLSTSVLRCDSKLWNPK